MEQSSRASAYKVAYQVKPFHKKRIENFLQRPDISKYFAPEDEQDEERETRTKTINLGQLTDELFLIHIWSDEFDFYIKDYSLREKILDLKDEDPHVQMNLSVDEFIKILKIFDASNWEPLPVNIKWVLIYFSNTFDLLHQTLARTSPL